MVLLDLKDLWDQLDHKVPWDLLDLGETKDPTEISALQEILDLRVKEEIQGHQEHLEMLVAWVQLDPMDRQVILELAEPLGHQVTLERLAHKVCFTLTLIISITVTILFLWCLLLLWPAMFLLC